MAKNYTVLRNDKVGRYAVASKDLKAGDDVLTELPIAVGPKCNTQPICLGCYWPWGDDGSVCEDCGWPVCGPQCAARPEHREAECGVFKMAGARYHPEVEGGPEAGGSPQFECITPLRILLAKEKDPMRWDAEVTVMEAHTELRKVTPDWATEHINVVEFLRRKCKLADRFSEDLIHFVIGVLEVNAFEVRTEHGYFVRGLYPQTAIMSHSCVANTTHSIYAMEDYRSHVRTTIHVPESGELFASYTSSIQPTIFRRENLKFSKYFDCDCPRCSDPTELGTHLSTIKCTKCDNGVITSSNPLDNEATWNCSHCEFSIRADTIRKIFRLIQHEIEQVGAVEEFDAKIQKLEKLLKKYKSVLHPRNVYNTSIRHSLIQLYGRAPGYTFADLPDVLLERKIELCEKVLEVVDVVKPGMNRFRGIILYEFHVPLMLFNRSRYEYNVLSKEEFKKKMEEVANILEEAIIILCLEDPTTPEGVIGQTGKESLTQLKESIAEL